MADKKTVVETLYDRCAAGDWAAVEALLADDFTLIEADGLPYGGTYRGRGALREVYEKVFGYWSALSIDLHEITVGDTHAIGLLTLSGTAKRTGKAFSMLLGEVFRFRGDKVEAIIPLYFDTKELAEIA